jgi:nucleotidyltransferase substrate binding protein (TIGR01987 family)
MNKESIKIIYLLKARDRFNEYCKNLRTDQEQAGAVQAFEYCHELTWKLLKKVLIKFENAPEIKFSKDIFRQAAIAKLIDDPQLWFDFNELRNKTVHTYNEDVLKEIVAAMPIFKKELDSLIERLQKNYTFDQ